MRFNVIIAVWGESYVSSLCDITLPSLVPPEGDDVLASESWKFVIYTTEGDTDRIRGTLSRLFPRIDAVSVAIRPQNFSNHYLAMASAHHLGARLSIADKARGVLIPPDAVFSSGALSAIAKVARTGKRAMMISGPRLKESSARGPLAVLIGETPQVPSRALVAFASKHLHPEMRRYFWASDDFSSRPFVCYWDAPNGWMTRNFHLHPLMIDFSTDTAVEILERDTIDGEFLGAAIGVWDDIHIVQDSDELTAFTLTPDEVFYSVQTDEKASADVLRRTAYEDGIVNPLHRWFFTKAVKIHSGDLDDTWRKLEEETGRLTFDILSYRRPPEAPAPLPDAVPAGVPPPPVVPDSGVVARLKNGLLGKLTRPRSRH